MFGEILSGRFQFYIKQNIVNIQQTINGVKVSESLNDSLSFYSQPRLRRKRQLCRNP